MYILLSVMDWIHPFPNLYVEILAPHVMVFGGGSLGSSFRWGLEGEVIIMRLASLKEEKERPELSLCLVKTPARRLLLLNHSVVSDYLWINGLQHTRLLCPVLSPRVCSNSCPLSWWCYLTASFSVTLFSSCPQSFPASGSFPVSWLFTTGSQSIRAST